MPTGSSHVQRVELEVGDATLEFTPEEFRDVVRRLLPDEQESVNPQDRVP